MKLKIIIIIFLAFLQITAFAQFSVKTECEYLQLINNQQNKFLIKDNLVNAELVAHQLMEKQKKAFGAEFLFQLAKSYSILNESSEAFFFLLAQRCLYPNDTLANQQEPMFFELAYENNLSSAQAKYYWNSTIAPKLPNSYHNRMLILLQLSVQLYQKNISNEIYQTGMVFRKIADQVPAWYQHWEFLTEIGVNEKIKKQILEPNQLTNQAIYSQLSGKLKHKIYKKAIKHYLKENAKIYANELVEAHKKEELSGIKNLDIALTRLRFSVF